MIVHPDILKMFQDLYTHGDHQKIEAQFKVPKAKLVRTFRRGEGDETTIDAMYKFYIKRHDKVEKMVARINKAQKPKEEIPTTEEILITEQSAA